MVRREQTGYLSAPHAIREVTRLSYSYANAPVEVFYNDWILSQPHFCIGIQDLGGLSHHALLGFE